MTVNRKHKKHIYITKCIVVIMVWHGERPLNARCTWLKLIGSDMYLNENLEVLACHLKKKDLQGPLRM